MPMFMDIHPGLGDATAEDVAEAHKRDLAIQDQFGVKFLTYWFDDPNGKAFCLVESPDSGSAIACHKAAHGLMPHEMIEVNAPTMMQFLSDSTPGPDHRAMIGSEPDSGLRAIMFTDVVGSTDMSTSVGDDAALDAVRVHDAIVRECLSDGGGREVKHTGDGILASFVSVLRALDAAIGIQQKVDDVDGLGIKIGLSAGEPVEDSDDIYGASVNLAARICSHAPGGTILVSSIVRDLAIGKQIDFADRGAIALKGFPDPVSLFEVPWA